jgi:hypothetical protein
MFGHRHPAKPDQALLARVTDANEVALGTYPEDVLAVVGAYPARGALDRRPDGVSSFRRLDGDARRAAMQVALDRLTADGTLDLPARPSLEDVVTDGLDGKLEVNGPMGDLYRLGYWFHRRGFASGTIVNLATSDGLQDVQMPYGVSPPGVESCFGLPASDDGGAIVLLVERPDNEAGTRTYTLRTVRQEFTRLAAFLFADVTTEGEMLLGAAAMSFRFGQASLKVDARFIRKDGEDVAYGRMTTETTPKTKKKKGKEKEPGYLKASSGELVDALTKYYVGAAGRTQ